MQEKFRVASRFIQHSMQRYKDTGCSYRAAALSFMTLLSLLPLMTLGFSILAKFQRFKTISHQIQAFIVKNFLASSGQTLQLHFSNFIVQISQLSTLSLIFLIITATMLMFTLEQSLNSIWKTDTRRHWTLTALLYWTGLLLIPILIGSALFLAAQITSVCFAKTGLINNTLLIWLSFFLRLFAFTFLYTMVPHCTVLFRYGLFGAFIATCLFGIAKYAFGLYIYFFPTYKILYGTLSAFPVFLVWIYICWVITLIGAVASYSLATAHASAAYKK